MRKPKAIWITLILSLFAHFFLIGRFNYLLEVPSDKKIIEKSYVTRISLKLKTNLSSPLENLGVPNLKSVPDFQNIKNDDREKQILHLEEKIVKRELPVEEIIQDNRDKKEIPYSPVMKKIENQEEITEDLTQKVSTAQVIKEETPQSPVETGEKINQIKQEPGEELLFNKTISAEKMEEKPVQGDFNTALQEADYKNKGQVKNNPEIEEILDFSANNYPDNVNPPELLEFQRPVYPKNLREREIEGKVILKILIDKEGKVQEIHIFESSGYEAFDQIAVKSVRQWQFKPAKKGNQPRESWVLIPINFQIKK
ncbi:MAG: energy transducer TonB [Atribacterota bacterium]|nr:energy transducer TonB [Atribacterota bacterium]